MAIPTILEYIDRGRSSFLSIKIFFKKLKVALQDHYTEKSKNLMVQSKEVITQLKEEFEWFNQYINQHSEFWRYLQLLNVNIDYLKYLIAANQYGNWHAHLQAMKSL